MTRCRGDGSLTLIMLRRQINDWLESRKWAMAIAGDDWPLS